MRQPKRLQFFGLLFIVCTFLSCKKRDAFFGLSQKESNVTEKFFSLPTTSPLSVKRVAAALQQINDRTGFIPQLAEQEGFAIWDKAIVQPRHYSYEGRNTPTDDVDTLVYLPLVLSGEDHVNAFIQARLNGNVSLKLYRSKDYAVHGFGNLHSGSANADKLAIQFMLLDFETFGHERFKLVDDSLLRSPALSTGSVMENRTVKISKVRIGTANRGNYETWGYDICKNVRYLQCTTNHSCCPDGSCDACQAVCWKTRFECETVAMTVFVDDGDWELVGGGGNSGGGGGAGGTGQNNGMIPCNPTPLLDNGLLPCPTGNTTGWQPFIPVQVTRVSDSLITDPCLKAIIGRMDKFIHNNVILRAYDEANYTPTTAHRYKVSYRMDTALMGMNGQPIPGYTEVFTEPDGSYFVSISLNNKLFQTASKEWVTSVILHELHHGIYTVTNVLDTTNELAHKRMFDKKVPLSIKYTLMKLFPLMDENDAFALGMDGLGLPGIFLLPDANNPGMTVIDPVKNQFAIDHYFQTIAQAISAIVPYRTGAAGTPYC